MHTNIVSYPKNIILRAANDDRPSGPAGNVVSLKQIRKRERVIRTVRGVFYKTGATGIARAA
ncbi:hypothetical protein [Psychromarinibacter sp. S121]|uniref:hypothetical protein n=1 Tax=Psychromarinibacter sp. S121 TaxID=3415127 RepID=UPI003C7E6051